jgi:hypothetical protein
MGFAVQQPFQFYTTHENVAQDGFPAFLDGRSMLEPFDHRSDRSELNRVLCGRDNDTRPPIRLRSCDRHAMGGPGTSKQVHFLTSARNR